MSPFSEIPSGGATTATARHSCRLAAGLPWRTPSYPRWGIGSPRVNSHQGHRRPYFRSTASELGNWPSSLEERNFAEGARDTPADHYRRIAFEYLALQSQGEGRGIQKKLAEQQDPPRQWQTIRDWLAKATELEFLTPGNAWTCRQTAWPEAL